MSLRSSLSEYLIEEHAPYIIEKNGKIMPAHTDDIITDPTYDMKTHAIAVCLFIGFKHDQNCLASKLLHHHCLLSRFEPVLALNSCFNTGMKK